MSKSPDFNLELSEMLYNDNTGSMIMNPEQKYKEYKKIDVVSSKWFINVIPRNAILSPYTTINKIECNIKKYKFRTWGFKNEFLKAYDYLMGKKISFKTLPAFKTKCPFCPYVEEKCELFYVEMNYGNFCWGTLLKHMVSSHNFKPMRFFIEYVYYSYCYYIYRVSTKKIMDIVKIDENTLNHFELMSRLGYEKKINLNNTNYNVEYFGTIIPKCGYAEKQMPSVKSRIKNIGIYFGNMKVDGNKLISNETEPQYDKNFINYLYYVRPYDIQKRFFNMANGKYPFEVPEYNEYIAFNSLIKQYPNLLGLLIFANEGIYLISKLDLNKDIINLDKFNVKSYNQFYNLINQNYLSFMVKYAYALHKSVLTERDKYQCYEHYQHISMWINSINGFIEKFNLKVVYFPKITVKKINDKYGVNENKLIYDTIYLPINRCFTD